MGLDIYLYSAEQARQNDEYDEASEALYEEGPDGKSPRSKMSDEEYAAWSERYDYTSYDKVPSERYPDHLFNRRYLRSSYNSGGFNHAVPDFLATTGGGTYPDHEGSLYWIFEPMGREWDGDEGALNADDVPKLRKCKARALDVAERLRKVDPLRVEEEGNVFSPPRMKPADFLAWYREQKAQHEGKPSPFGDGGYSTRDGAVFGFDKGLEVLAITVGIGTLGEPAALIVYRSGYVDGYIQSAEITAEFCDEAIALIERDGAAQISWSG